MGKNKNTDSFRTKKHYFFLKLRWNIHHVFNQILSFFEKEEDGILLIPPTHLDGSFGDELMTVTFINQFDENKKITIYESKFLERVDLFGTMHNVSYLKYKYAPKFHKLKGGVYILGADNMTPSYGISFPSFKCRVLKFANKYDIPTGILGFSLNKGIINSELEKDFLELIPNTHFKLREPDSFEVAKTFLPIENIQQVSDLAFLCPYNKNSDEDFLSWVSVKKAESKIIAAICPNSIQAHKVGIEEYVNQFTTTLEEIQNKKNVVFVFLYHDIRGKMNDRDLAEKIYLKLKEKNLDIYFKDNITNGVVLKSYLELVDFTITGRMHFGISGYSLAKPMFGISYEGKFSGLQKLFGVSAENSLISYTKMEDFYPTLERFINNLSEFSINTKENLPKVIALSQKNFEEIK